MTAAILLGTDNGYIVRHDLDSGIDSIVWDDGGGHSAGSNAVTLQPAAFSAPSKVSSLQNAGDANAPLWSDDGGETWTTAAPSIPGGYDTVGWPRLVGKDGTFNANIDEAGSMWVRLRETAGPNHSYLAKSPDHTMASWSVQFDATAAFGATPIFSVYLSGGYIWWLRGSASTLHRLGVDGTNHQSWAVTVQGSVSDFASFSLNGFPRTKRLVAWDWAQDSGTRTILSIDITDPDNPDFTWSPDDVFGASVPIWDVCPLTNQIIVANAVNDAFTAGAIWRSTDGGATWSEMVASTANLASVFAENEISAVAVNPSNAAQVAVAMTAPYVYYSEDSGATWSLITVDTGIFGTVPTDWDSVVLAGGAPVGTARRRGGFAQFIS